jgi:hypothetical protein
MGGHARAPRRPLRITIPKAANHTGTYMKLFKAGVVYLEVHGVSVELSAREQGGANVVLRLPIETAKQLGLQTTVPPERWESACDENKSEPLRRLQGSVRRSDDPTDAL